MSRLCHLVLWAVTLLPACSGDDGDYVPDPAPLAHDDHFTIAEDSGTLTRAMLVANDEHVGTGCGGLIPTTPLHGTFDTQVAYHPDPGFHGTDAFTYTLSDCRGNQSAGSVIVDVTSDGVPFEQSVLVDESPGTALASGDLDGDGRVDLVTTDGSTILILQNRTTAPGAYAMVPARFEGGHLPVAIAVADLDGDGRADIITAAGIDGLVVLRNITPSGGALAFAEPLLVPAGTAAGVVAVDLDGNGTPDLASIDNAGNHLDLRLNTSTPGAISFGARTSFTTLPGPLRLESVDVDGSAQMDLVVLSRGPGNYDGAFSLFVNATAVGDTVPAFGARIDRATGVDPKAIFVADLDGDQRSEIGVLDDGLWVYANATIGAGTPRYEAARVFDVDPHARVVAAVNLDLNGAVDLMLGAQNDAPLSVLLNRSTSATFSFEAHTSEVAGELHGRARLGTVTAIRLVELDGGSPAEIVVVGTEGTRVLFGD